MEVLRQAEEEFMSFLDAALVGPTPLARLNSFFRQALEIHRGDGFVGGCLFGNTALEACGCNPHYARRAADVFARWIGKIAMVIEEAQAADQVRTDLPAAVLGQFVVAALEGGIMMARLRKDEEPLRRCLDTLRTLMEV